MIYFCAQKNRRALVLQSKTLNGIDYLEVLGEPGCGKDLAVTFLHDPGPLKLTPDNFVINGGAPVAIDRKNPHPIEPSKDEQFTLILHLDGTGDFSTYTLAIVAGSNTTDPPAGLDPQLSSVDFSFKAGCSTPADCLPSTCCPIVPQSPPDINYLAKDYDGFRQVMLDRLAVLSPNWSETHAADLGVALVETLAYAADHLSYQQDGVSTEAYLGTARNRISLRRHARLVDYPIGEGCNARVWVYLRAGTDGFNVPQGTLFYVRNPGLPAVVDPHGPFVQALAASQQPVFASLQDAVLHTEQNEMHFYTWSDAACCLPAGATEATLAGHFASLQPGTVLIFEEVAGPLTGDPADADPARRCAVRLTSATANDGKQHPLVDPLDPTKQITRIAWSPDDALPFPICISSTTDAAHGARPVDPVSVARGNIVAADHGVLIAPREQLGAVPAPPPMPAAGAGCTCGSTAPVATPRSRYYPQLAKSPLTFSVAFNPTASARAFLSPPDPNDTQPTIKVKGDDDNIWNPMRDLLASDDTQRVFVAEIDQNGSVFLRFGDGQYGMAPDAGMSFSASYRVGNGTVGNVGRDTLGHVLLAGNGVTQVRNPLAAAGGVDPEDMEHIRQYAPFAFATQERCVTADDYGQAAAQLEGIREARGTLRWTGSWYTAFVSVDPAGALAKPLVTNVASKLDLLRMMGTDLVVEGATIVGLQIEMDICIDPEHFQGDVYAALTKVFVTGDQCNGKSGLLNAANFTFGETVYASPLVAAAQAVDGVLSATLTVFTRMDDPSIDGVAQGFLAMGRLEIPRCDNDPNRLDHGQFQLHLDGGK
jgi:hypothetical protein